MQVSRKVSPLYNAHKDKLAPPFPSDFEISSMSTKFTPQSKYFSITVPTVIYGTARNLGSVKNSL